MTTYLMSAKEMPFTAADIRAELGLLDPRFDNTITAKIGSTIIMCESRWECCLRRQTWAVQRIKGQPLGMFFRAIRAIGMNPKIGPAYSLALNPSDKLGPFHDCTFEPDHRRLTAVKAMIVNWCWGEFDISSAILRERRGEYRAECPERHLMAAE